MASAWRIQSQGQSSQESREKEDRRKESTSSQAPPEKDNPQTDHPIILTRLFSYTDKVFGLRKQWKLRVSDSRPKARIPTAVFPAAFFAMFSCRLPSFNELEQHRHKSSWHHWLGGPSLPSADELAYASERIDPQGLRECLGSYCRFSVPPPRTARCNDIKRWRWLPTSA